MTVSPGLEAALLEKSAALDEVVARLTQAEGDRHERDMGLLRQVAHKTAMHRDRRLSVPESGAEMTLDRHAKGHPGWDHA